MTKVDIVNKLYDVLGFSKRECAAIADKFFEIVKEALANGDQVKISGFGNFVVKEKKARKGRNPQTGDKIELAARRVLLFRLSKVLKNQVNRTQA